MQNQLDYYHRGQFITREHQKQTFFKNTLTRTVANLVQSCFVFFVIGAYNLFISNNKKYKYNVCICAIFKNEARYLDEWIKYHLLIGVEHFYMYNNESEDDYLGVLQPYINEGLIDLVEWPQPCAQMLAYEDCYNNHRQETQWLTFVDIDEFICPISTDDIRDWLVSYKQYPGVAVYWRQFGSNGKLDHDSNQLVIEQYTQCWPKFSCYTKMFCNMNFDIDKFHNMHILKSRIWKLTIPPINQYKKVISFGRHRTSVKQGIEIQINHYWGKAYDVFLEKVNRTDAHYSATLQMKQIRLQLLKSHEAMCTAKDFTIQRFLLYTKLKNY